MVLVALILGFLLKMAPTWKELKIREFDQRGLDNQTREKEAAALSLLSHTLEVIAVEQRKATEAVELSQRINSDSANKLDELVRTVSFQFSAVADRVEKLEKEKDQGPGEPN